jgi:hypothetical protein
MSWLRLIAVPFLRAGRRITAYDPQSIRQFPDGKKVGVSRNIGSAYSAAGLFVPRRISRMRSTWLCTPSFAGELAELRFVGQRGKLLEPRNQPGRQEGGHAGGTDDSKAMGNRTYLDGLATLELEIRAWRGDQASARPLAGRRPPRISRS